MLLCTADSLFVSPAQTLVNPVNTVGVMGKGIALEFKMRYPTMFGRYKEFCDLGELEVGRLQLYRTANKWVLNFPTKKHWRGRSRLEWIEAGLQKFVDTYEARGITSVSLPQLGCGNGGLRWGQVGPLMERYLGGLPIPVLIHIRANPRGFTAEHEVPEEVELFSNARERIDVDRFFSDVFGLVGQELVTQKEDDPDAPAPLPDLQLSSEMTIQGSELEGLWYRLSRRGALPFDELPGRLAGVAGELAEQLLRLDYVRRMSFIRGCADGDPELVEGLRFAPGPISSMSASDQQLALVESATA